MNEKFNLNQSAASFDTVMGRFLNDFHGVHLKSFAHFLKLLANFLHCDVKAVEVFI